MSYKGLHRSHDYKFLLQRWRALCRDSGMQMKVLAELDGFPCFEVISPTISLQPTIYISAGIHGMKPAPRRVCWRGQNRGRTN